ncbi:hypothetical protein BgiMline_014603, partial [Biomphalaria glabrata]
TTEALLSLHSRVVKLETMNEITQSLQAKYETEITELRQEILKIRNETTEALSSLESRLVKVETKNEKTNKTFSTMAYSVVFYGVYKKIKGNPASPVSYCYPHRTFENFNFNVNSSLITKKYYNFLLCIYATLNAFKM